MKLLEVHLVRGKPMVDCPVKGVLIEEDECKECGLYRGKEENWGTYGLIKKIKCASGEEDG